MKKLLSTKITSVILFLFALSLFTGNFAAAQDSDGDGLSDAIDCKPFNPALGPTIVWTDMDGDGYWTCRTGCFSFIFPPCSPENPGYVCISLTQVDGQGHDCDDAEPMIQCRPGPGPSAVTYNEECVQSPDSDNDGESDLTDCAPTNAMVYHGAPEICDGIDNDCDGVIDEGCTSGCNGDPQKVTICHNNHTICIAPSAVAAHQAHGDQTGQCPNSTIHSVELAVEENLMAGFIISPNPARGKFTVTLAPVDNNSERLIRLLSHTGQLIKEIRVQQQRQVNVNIDKAGTYLVQVIAGKKVTTKKLVVLR